MTAAGTRSVASERSACRRRVAAKPHPLVQRHLSFRRRLKAAGLPPDEPWEAHNEFARARRIAMWIDDWHGCPLPSCRRHRGCMAPYLYCTNREARRSHPEPPLAAPGLVPPHPEDHREAQGRECP